MSVHKKTPTIVMARQLHAYRAGDRVRVLRGKLAGREFSISQCANDWVLLSGTLAMDVMSKGNVEPVEGFTQAEFDRATGMATVGLG